MTGEMLSISGERKEETEHKGAQSYRSEHYFGRFQRSIPVPAAVEGGRIEAHYKDGVLTVTCPKTEEARKDTEEMQATVGQAVPPEHRAVWRASPRNHLHSRGAGE